MSQKILVIDDHEVMRDLLQEELQESGYDVVTAESCFDGLNILKEQEFKLVILDIRMPGMDGIEALEKIINANRGLPVIIHSAFSHYKENYLTWSAADYIVKSGDLQPLKDSIAQHIR
ncbi:MAG: response regulator [SAR324 cluster bacterium]|nr:response regulator [SAR324 cluster bacterium]